MSFSPASGEPAGVPAFTSVAEHMPGALLQYVPGPSGEQRIGWMSQGCRDIREVAPQAPEQDANVLWSMVDAHGLVVMRALLVGASSSSKDWVHEWRITTPSGQRKWFHGVWRPQSLADGWVVWNAVIVDMSDGQQSFDAMRDSEARFGQLLEFVPKVSVQGDGLDLTTRDWNQASERLYGIN